MWILNSNRFPTEGAKHPKHENQKCNGIDLSNLTIGSLFDQKQLNLSFLIDAYTYANAEDVDFFLENNFFEKLAGTASLRDQVKNGWSADEIRASWKEDIDHFKIVREKYLLYD